MSRDFFIDSPFVRSATTITLTDWIDVFTNGNTNYFRFSYSNEKRFIAKHLHENIYIKNIFTNLKISQIENRSFLVCLIL